MSDRRLRELERLAAQGDRTAEVALAKARARLVDEPVVVLGWALRYGKEPIWHLVLGQKQFVENLGYSLNRAFANCKKDLRLGSLYPSPRSYTESGHLVDFPICKKCTAKMVRMDEEGDYDL